jgi:nitroreductase
MSAVSAESILAQLHWRYATKVFDPKRKLTAQQWAGLAEVLRLAPSSYGLQPWKFFLVQNRELRLKLRTHSYDQAQVVDCSHFVVMASLRQVSAQYVRTCVQSMADERGLSLESLLGYQSVIEEDIVRGPRAKVAKSWAQRQVYIAMGMLLQSAALLEIDACPMEGIECAAYDQVLGLEGSDYATVAAVALGFRSASDSLQGLKKVRFPITEVLQVLE